MGVKLRGLTAELMLLTTILLRDESVLIAEPFGGNFLGGSALKRVCWEALYQMEFDKFGSFLSGALFVKERLCHWKPTGQIIVSQVAPVSKEWFPTFGSPSLTKFLLT